jgi:hypothetical protein
MASKNNIDQAIYQFKKGFSNTQNFDIEVDRDYIMDYIMISRQYAEDRPKIHNKQQTFTG